LRGKYEQADESTLIRGCLRHHAGAQKVLYERFSARMMGVCCRYARSREDAEDMLQEGFVRVFTHLDQFRAVGSLEGWIRRIMVTTAINFLNRNKYLQQNTGLEHAEEIASDRKPEEDVQGGEMMQLLLRLPLGYRTIMNLYAIEGYSHKEIGEMLGIAESTSRSQYARARELLITIRKRRLSPRAADK
jgi:RNA polymerase sigma-70 factor (ECF subfamily)